MAPIGSEAPTPRQLVVSRQVFDGDVMRGPLAVEIAGGRIIALHETDGGPSDLPRTALPDDVILAPGFIDLQVNGGGGVLLNDDPSVAAVARIARAHQRFGTTGLLPTLITDAPGRMRALLDCAETALAMPGVLGFHLEGPFLSPARPGIHPPEHIRQPDADDIGMLVRFGALGRSLVTLAPERFDRDGLREIAGSSLRIAIGHSDASGRDVLAAIEDGATGVTHLFNAMSQMTPREPGVVGAALASDALYAGIICDGLHVDALSLKAAFRAKGKNRLMLVTDAMSLVGTSETDFELHGRRIALEDGRLADAQGTLAGAHLTMFDAVRNAVSMMGANLADALTMASRTPAAFLGLGHELGQIAPGFRADLVAFEPSGVIATWISGVCDVPSRGNESGGIKC